MRRAYTIEEAREELREAIELAKLVEDFWASRGRFDKAHVAECAQYELWRRLVALDGGEEHAE